jgi:hypothetical protein
MRTEQVSSGKEGSTGRLLAVDTAASDSHSIKNGHLRRLLYATLLRLFGFGRMTYRKSIMAGLVAVFSVLLFGDRAPDGGVSDTAVDKARSIPLIARNAMSGAPRNGPKN